MKIINVPLHEIKPYENNVKDHPVSQLEAVKNSIKDYGFRQNLVIDKNNVIVVGHARYEAAAVLGLKEVPCEIADDLTDEQIIEYRILDNEIAKQGSTKLDALQIELAKIPDFDFKPFNVEFPKIEIVKEGLCDEDEVPELKVAATTKLGDVWILGNHRLMCGDSTMIDSVEKLMNGEKLDMVFTDPPYGISIVSKNGSVGGGTIGKYDPIINDNSNETAIDAFNLCSGLNIPIMFFWGGNYYCNSLPVSSCWVVWDKQDGKHVTFADCELAWTNYDKPARLFKHVWDGFRRDSEKGEMRVHPTQKPIKLCEDIFTFFKSPNNILDLFGGSGSTLIACEKTNRKCFMMEISPAYCDVIVKRWQKFSGQEAYLESDNKKFNELSPLV